MALPSMSWLTSAFSQGTREPSPDLDDIEFMPSFPPPRPRSSSEPSSIDGKLQYPSLFSLELPPCGLLHQVAYSNIVHRLRNAWVKHVTSQSNISTDGIDVYNICKRERVALRTESSQHPPDTLAGTGLREPRRREEVFKFEMYWIRYFVREAQTMKDFGGMSENRRAAVQAQMGRNIVPGELDLKPENQMQQDVKNLWVEWHKVKRSWMAEYKTTMEDAESGAVIVNDPANSIDSLSS